MVRDNLVYLKFLPLRATATVDEFIDVIMKDHRKYIKW